MADPYLSEIRLMSFNFPPSGWALCNGQFLPIAQSQGLFSLLGTTYGGNGQTTFALPDLRGRVPIHHGAGYYLGDKGGEEYHTVTIAELPTHTHTPQFSVANATSSDGLNNVPAKTLTPAYGPAQNLVQMNASALTNIGSGQSHLNMQPYLVISFCIALQGIFPSQT